MKKWLWLKTLSTPVIVAIPTFGVVGCLDSIKLDDLFGTGKFHDANTLAREIGKNFISYKIKDEKEIQAIIDTLPPLKKENSDYKIHMSFGSLDEIPNRKAYTFNNGVYGIEDNLLLISGGEQKALDEKEFNDHEKWTDFNEPYQNFGDTYKLSFLNRWTLHEEDDLHLGIYTHAIELHHDDKTGAVIGFIREIAHHGNSYVYSQPIYFIKSLEFRRISSEK